MSRDFIAELKFSECLPPALRKMEIAAHYDCSEAMAVQLLLCSISKRLPATAGDAKRA